MRLTSLRFIAALWAMALILCGCQAGQLVGAMAQAHEDQKLVDTPPRYDGLSNRTSAVLVQADMATLYEFPDLVTNIAAGVSDRIMREVPQAQVLHPRIVLDWQYRNPQWNVLPYGELCEQLNVDRIVFIDVLEYRLNPPGNRYLWEGVCSARVGIIDRNSLDPDAFVNTFDITVKFPDESGLAREAAHPRAIQTGLLSRFVTQTGWLFYQHLEPKYPDRYRPELDSRNNNKKKS